MRTRSPSSTSASRLVCVVEGKGEVQAIPCLCTKVRDYFSVNDWFVDPNPIRFGRGLLVDETSRSPNRGPRTWELQRAVNLALRRPATAVMVVCDADDDCPKAWGPGAAAVVNGMVRGGAVMAVREYECWLLTSLVRSSHTSGRRIEDIRGAKEHLRSMQPGYKPALHQLKLTRALDVATVWALSDSFDKFVRTLAGIFGVSTFTRPLVP